MFRLSRPYYVYTLQLVVRRDETAYPSRLDDCKRDGVRVGTLGDTAASRLLTQKGIAYRTYDNQTTPYKDLEQKPARRRAARSADRHAVHQARPRVQREAEVRRQADCARFLRDRLSQGERGAGRPVRRGHRQAAGRMARCKRSTRDWDLWNDDQAALETGQLEETLHTSATKWTFAQFFPRLVGGALMTVTLTVLGFLLAMAIGLPVATARLYGPAPLRWLATIYVEFFRGIPVLLLLYFLYYSLPEVGLAMHLGVIAEAQRVPRGRDRLRPELRRLRVGNLSGRHRVDSRRPVGGRRPRWGCRRCGSSAASSFPRPSRSSCRP